MSFSSHEGLEEGMVTPPEMPAPPGPRLYSRALASNHGDCLQGPNDCHTTSPNTEHFCCSGLLLLFFFFVQNVKTVGFKIQPKHQLWEMHISKTGLLALKDITDLPGAKDCTMRTVHG